MIDKLPSFKEFCKQEFNMSDKQADEYNEVYQRYQDNRAKGKPHYVENCKKLDTCNNGRHRDCIGCNIWNMKYDMPALIDWCNKQDRKLMVVLEELRAEMLYG